MKPAAWLAAGLTCLAMSVAACGGDDDERRGSASAQRDATAESQPQRGSVKGSGEASGAGGADGAPGGEASTAPGDGGEGGVAQSGDEGGETSAGDRAGGGSSTGKARRVRATVAGFLAAMRAKNAPRACSFYTREVRQLVGGTLGVDCANGMEFVFLVIGPNRPALRKVGVTEVEVTGDRASAGLRLPRPLRTLPMLQLIAPDDRLSLEREGGRWRLGLAR
jgi:hypothetical protein